MPGSGSLGEKNLPWKAGPVLLSWANGTRNTVGFQAWNNGSVANPILTGEGRWSGMKRWLVMILAGGVSVFDTRWGTKALARRGPRREPGQDVEISPTWVSDCRLLRQSAQCLMIQSAKARSKLTS